ncbi:glucose transporter type 3 [Drosophila subpulchrella]|uniref:glucose transporter type 3 n=1 Tax=Drosophila subpulchrella TaxID=1486046 RepID=UPI0018A12DBE|nr:glucose transporter type 3 [Drosophila subpulchrella]
MKWGGRPSEPEPEPPAAESPRTSRWSKGSAKKPVEIASSPTQAQPNTISNVGLYKATFYSNIGSFFFGIAVGWSGSVEKSVMEHQSYLFNLSAAEWNGVCILLTLGAAVWCVPMGYMVRSCGCKRTILMQLLPNTLGWCLTAFAQSVYMLYAGRFVLGMCGGAHCVAVPIYNAEISTNINRGAMSVLFQGACICGVLYSFTMSIFLELWLVNFLNLGVLTLGLLQIFMPESPAYYVSRGNIPRAEASLRYLRGKKYDARREIDHLMREPTASEQDVRQGPTRGFKYKKIRRSLARTLALAVLQKLCGALIFIFYAPNMLTCLKIRREYGSVLAIGVTFGLILCISLVDRVGRRKLLIFSSSVMVFMSIFLGLYFKIWMFMETEVLPWVALFCISLFVGAYVTGVGSLTWLLNVELIVPAMRPLGCAIACTSNWLTAFFVVCWFASHEVKCQPYLFLLFAIIAVIILLFSMVFIPETKGLSSSKIQQRMGGIMNRPTVVTFTSSSDSSDA